MIREQFCYYALSLSLQHSAKLKTSETSNMEMEGFCRGCLIKYNEPMELLQYTEKNRRLFVYSTGLQVKRNDTFTFQLCKDCFLNMKLACKFKKLCRTSDRRFKSYMALKDVGDPVDFCTFLKNSDDTLTFRLPMASGNSTPANQKCRDDDNESTCTSIRNFMTDILQGEEMPDTEARIIKEVIEEEADVLDDSLDSHWLQEDMSIDTDFRLDLSFSPFSTPHTVNNDRCFTPKKYADQKEEHVNYYTLSEAKQTKMINDFTNAFKNDDNVKKLENCGVDDENSERNNVKEICEITFDEIDGNEKSLSNINKNKEDINELCDFSIHDIDSIAKSDKHETSLKELCDLSLDCMDKSESNSFVNDHSLKVLCDINNKEDTVSNPFGNSQSIKEMCDFGVDNVGDIKKSCNNLSLPSLDDLDKNKINILNFYIPKDDSVPTQSNNIGNGSKNFDAMLKDKPCTIDRNLEEALKNSDHKEFSLEDLLVSPPVYNGASAASTPTITNILFGEKLALTDNNMNSKVGQCIETFDNVEGDIEIFEEFFQNDTKEFDVVDIKREYVRKVDVGIDTEDTKVSIDMDTENNLEDKLGITTNKNGKAANIIDTTDKNNTVITTASSPDDRFDLENSYCKLCSKKFKNGRALSLHFRRLHNIRIIKPQQRPHQKMKLCNKCGKEFRYPNNFKNHVDKCSKPETTFQCELCPVECKTKATLARHMAHHTMTFKKKDTGKQYLCTICGLTINRIGNYNIHIKRHKKIYDKKCETCGKGFYGKWDLETHMRSHTGETPYVCKLCPRAFARRDVLSKHIRIHTGEKLYQCDNCGWKCYQKYYMQDHIIKKKCAKKAKKCKDKRVKNKKKDLSPIEQQVTVIYTTGDDNSIKKQLPFLETEMST